MTKIIKIENNFVTVNFNHYSLTGLFNAYVYKKNSNDIYWKIFNNNNDVVIKLANGRITKNIIESALKNPCFDLDENKPIKNQLLELIDSFYKIEKKIENLNKLTTFTLSSKECFYEDINQFTYKKGNCFDLKEIDNFLKYEKGYTNIISLVSEINNDIKQINVLIKKANQEIKKEVDFIEVDSIKIVQKIKDFYKIYKKMSEKEIALCIKDSSLEASQEKLTGFIVYVYNKEKNIEGFLGDKGNVFKSIGNSCLFISEKEASNFASRKGFKGLNTIIETEIRLKDIKLNNNETGPILDTIKSLKEQQSLDNLLSLEIEKNKKSKNKI